MSARRIGSRGSDLALWQSRTVLGALSKVSAAPAWHPEVVVVTTRGDIDPSPYLAGRVEKGAFTKELELVLAAGEIDLVVHSLKDLPTAAPPGLLNRTVLPRATAADWLLIRPEFHEPHADGLLPLRAGTRVGASSLRRTALIARHAPQARPVPLRGNVPTRLRRLAEGENVDAIVLAAAGLSRLALDLSGFVVIELSPEVWVPAPGQGALAAQCREGDADIARQIDALVDADCDFATRWEREFLRVIEGGCSTPFGCHVIGRRAWLGIATDEGWAASSVELPPNLTFDPTGNAQREHFIRTAVAGCRPDAAGGARPLGRTLRAR